MKKVKSVLITYFYFQIKELSKFWQLWTKDANTCILESYMLILMKKATQGLMNSLPPSKGVWCSGGQG